MSISPALREDRAGENTSQWTNVKYIAVRKPQGLVTFTERMLRQPSLLRIKIIRHISLINKKEILSEGAQNLMVILGLAHINKKISPLLPKQVRNPTTATGKGAAGSLLAQMN